MKYTAYIRKSLHFVNPATEEEYLTNLVAFYNMVTQLIGKGRVTDVIHLDLYKESDNVLHGI